MPLVLEEVSSDQEFDAIWPMLFRAYKTSFDSLAKYFNPVHVTLDAATKMLILRHTEWWRVDPDCHWIEVPDTDLEEPFGPAC